MALDQSALLEVLDALRTADAGERITQAAETISNGPNGRDCADLSEPLAVANGRELRPGI